jgi:hypothetical protein
MANMSSLVSMYTITWTYTLEHMRIEEFNHAERQKVSFFFSHASIMLHFLFCCLYVERKDGDLCVCPTPAPWLTMCQPRV